jgi:cell division protein FtsZ
LIHVDYSHLCSLLRDRHADSAFATAEAQGEGRAREVIEQVLACPLLEGGDSLAEAEAVLVNLTGGPDLSMADIKRVMDELNRRTDNAQVVMGASIADEMQGRIGLSLVACRRPGSQSPEASFGERMAVTPSAPGPSNRFAPGQGGERVRPGDQPPALDPDLQGNSDVPCDRPGVPVKFSPRRLQQGRLKLDIVAKGRFEKSPPTIHRGEDLDVPTYVRRGIPLN